MAADALPFHSRARGDALIVATCTVLAAVVCVTFDVSERVLHWTSPREGLQLDELPGVLLVLTACLAWFAWRRYREGRGEIARRQATEASLAQALADNRNLGRQYVARWEDERTRLARELHDELGQYLNAIKLDAIAIRDRYPTSAPEASAAARSIVEGTDHVHRVVTGMIRRLRPAGLDELGLEAALEDCMDGWRVRLQGTTLHLRFDGARETFGEAVDLVVYRLAQEGLTNVAKHAHASDVKLEIATRAIDARHQELTFLLEDDGIGASNPQRSGGFGLLGMRERVEQLGGCLSVATAPGQGFRLTATMPI